MFSKNKIAAFTMMDVLTGMVLMSIVVVMVFYLLSATTGQASNYQAMRIRLNDYLLMRADLRRQVELADKIEKVPGGFCLVSILQSVSYVQYNDHLVRKSGTNTDTLFTGLEQIILAPFTGLVLQQADEPLVAAVLLKLKYNDQLLNCYLYKDYGLSEPLNQQLYREP